MNDNKIKVNNNEATLLNATNNSSGTLYGNHIVANGSKYKWKLRLNKFGYTGSTPLLQWRKLINPSIDDKRVVQELLPFDMLFKCAVAKLF